MQKSNLPVPLAILSLLLLMGPCPRAKAASEMVWQFGKFNMPSNEFAPALLFGYAYPEAPVVYITGKTNPEKEWPAFQPERQPRGWVSSFPAHYSVQFARPPRGTLHPKKVLLVEAARVPELQVR